MDSGAKWGQNLTIRLRTSKMVRVALPLVVRGFAPGTPSPTATATATPTPTATTTSTPTATPTPTATTTSAPTATPTPTATATFTSTATPTPTGTMTFTPTATPVPTQTETPTPSPTPVAGGIHGHVTYNGAAAAAIELRLMVYDGLSATALQKTTTGADGGYVFTGVPTLPAGQRYYVEFGPNATDGRYLSRLVRSRHPLVHGRRRPSQAVTLTSRM